MNLAVALPSFLASSVEFVEALTIVLAIGVTRGWRSPLLGAIAAAALLLGITVAFGVTLTQLVPISILRVVVGILILLFGIKWLRKAIMRFTGLKATHDEHRSFAKRPSSPALRLESRLVRWTGLDSSHHLKPSRWRGSKSPLSSLPSAPPPARLAPRPPAPPSPALW